MSNSKTWTLLHLTDIHFGDVYTDDDKTPLAAAFRENLKTRFAESLQHFVAALQENAADPSTIFDVPETLTLPDAFVVTGDLTVRGDAAAMTKCVGALFDLTNALHTARVPVAIVPGNHDIDWQLSGKESNYFTRKFKAFVDAVQALKARTCLIPMGGLGDHEIQFDPDFEPVVVDSTRKLVIVCLNSAIRCGEANAALIAEAELLVKELEPKVRDSLLSWMKKRCVSDIAHITQAQRVRVEEALLQARAHIPDWNDYLKVAVLHHHLVGMAGPGIEYKAFEMTVDAPQVLQMLVDHDVDLILTGHKHRPYAVRNVCRRSDGSDREIVIAGGATVLGGLARGVRDYGLNRVRVRKDTNGALTVDFDVIGVENEALTRQQTRVPLPHTRIYVAPRSVLPGTYVDGVPLLQYPTESVSIDGKRHEPVRLYSGISLAEYCRYCKQLAAKSRRLFTLLTIAPSELLREICDDEPPPSDQDAFLEIADKAGTHFRTYRSHSNAVRVVITSGSDWVNRNRAALPYLNALNGQMRCLVATKAQLQKVAPEIFLMDRTAVDDQVCMYDSASYMMTVGPLAAMDTAGFGKFFSGLDTLRAAGFVPFDEFLKQHGIGESL